MLDHATDMVSFFQAMAPILIANIHGHLRLLLRKKFTRRSLLETKRVALPICG